MKTRRLATAVDSGRVSCIRAQAAGLVSSMMVSNDGLCSARVSLPFHARVLLESGTRPTFCGLIIVKVTGAVGAVHVEIVSPKEFLIIFSMQKRASMQNLGRMVHDGLHVDGDKTHVASGQPDVSMQGDAICYLLDASKMDTGIKLS